MDISEAKRLRELERENVEKKMVAEMVLDILMLKDFQQPKVVRQAERRCFVTWLRNEHGVSKLRACQAMQMNCSSHCYVGVQEPMNERYVLVVSLPRSTPCWGYRKIYALMRAEEVRISRERVR